MVGASANSLTVGEAFRHHGLDRRRSRCHRASPGRRVSMSTSRSPFFQPVTAQPGVGERAEVAQQQERGQRQHTERTQQGTAQQLVPAEPLSSTPCRKVSSVRSSSSSGRVERLALLDRLLVRHQLLRPDHHAGADAEQRQRQRAAEREVHVLAEVVLLVEIVRYATMNPMTPSVAEEEQRRDLTLGEDVLARVHRRRLTVVLDQVAVACRPSRARLAQQAAGAPRAGDVRSDGAVGLRTSSLRATTSPSISRWSSLMRGSRSTA